MEQGQAVIQTSVNTIHHRAQTTPPASTLKLSGRWLTRCSSASVCVCFIGEWKRDWALEKDNSGWGVYLNPLLVFLFPHGHCIVMQNHSATPECVCVRAHVRVRVRMYTPLIKCYGLMQYPVSPSHSTALFRSPSFSFLPHSFAPFISGAFSLFFSSFSPDPCLLAKPH